MSRWTVAEKTVGSMILGYDCIRRRLQIKISMRKVINTAGAGRVDVVRSVDISRFGRRPILSTGKHPTRTDHGEYSSTEWKQYLFQDGRNNHYSSTKIGCGILSIIELPKNGYQNNYLYQKHILLHILYTPTLSPTVQVVIISSGHFRACLE